MKGTIIRAFGRYSVGQQLDLPGGLASEWTRIGVFRPDSDELPAESGPGERDATSDDPTPPSETASQGDPPAAPPPAKPTASKPPRAAKGPKPAK